MKRVYDPATFTARGRLLAEPRVETRSLRDRPPDLRPPAGPARRLWLALRCRRDTASDVLVSLGIALVVAGVVWLPVVALVGVILLAAAIRILLSPLDSKVLRPPGHHDLSWDPEPAPEMEPSRPFEGAN